MKKIIKLLFATAALICASHASADNSGTPITNPNRGICFLSTYWGTEASQKPNNPCKGATTRKCAEIENQLVQMTDCISIKTVFTNESGVSHTTTTKNYSMTMDQIIEKLYLDLPENAEIEQVN